MRILVLSPYIYDKSIPEFSINKTGFGIMVKDIVESISENNNVFLLTKAITKGNKSKGCNYTILKHTFLDIIKNIRLSDIIEAIKISLKFKQSFKNRLRYFYYYLDKGCIEINMKKALPDIVHIHGVGYITKPYIDICNKLKIPYIITLHGLNGISDSIKIDDHEKDLEKKIILECAMKKIKVTVISSGIKESIKKYYNISTIDNISVVLNGTKINEKDRCKIDIRKKYNIDNSNSIILVIGKVCLNKNQLDIVDAYHTLSDYEKNKMTILFIGSDGLQGELQKKIEGYGYSRNLIYCGFIDKNELYNYYEQAELNIVISTSEGFGLPIIEGFLYGLPTLMYDDIDSFNDLYNERSIYAIKRGNYINLSNGIRQALEKVWNKEEIKEYANKFLISNISREYEDVYVEAIKDNLRMESFNG